MLHTIATWLAVVAFVAAAVNNSLGRKAAREDYVRWGYPDWWCYVTGLLEFVTAALIAIPAVRVAGLVLGAAIVLGAIVTVARRREFSHLPPLGIFVVLLAAAAFVRAA